MTKAHIVKRKGRVEDYDSRKVYASVYAAALNAHYSEGAAEQLAKLITEKVDAWAKKQDSFFSFQIKDEIVSNLDDKDVALMYTHHLDIC